MWRNKSARHEQGYSHYLMSSNTGESTCSPASFWPLLQPLLLPEHCPLTSEQNINLILQASPSLWQDMHCKYSYLLTLNLYKPQVENLMLQVNCWPRIHTHNLIKIKGWKKFLLKARWGRVVTACRTTLQLHIKWLLMFNQMFVIKVFSLV